MKRQHLLLGALAGTLGVTAWVASLPDDEPTAATAVPVARTAGRQAAAAPPPASAPGRPPRRAGWTVPGDSALAAWAPPPKPAPPAAAARPASTAGGSAAPAFPYRPIGRLVQDEARPIALLDGPRRSIGAAAGDVIDGQWRVERVADDRLELTWLPGAERLMVPMR